MQINIETIQLSINQSIQDLNLEKNELKYSILSKDEFKHFELGTLKLKPNKLFLIFKELLLFSLLKRIKINLNFDEFLLHKPEYLILLDFYEEIFRLKEKESFDKDDIQNFITKYDIIYFDEYIFFIFSYSGKKYYDLKYFYMAFELTLKSLSLWKNQLSLKKIISFELAHNDLQDISQSLNIFFDALFYYNIIIDYKNSNQLKLDVFTYHNIALFHRIAGNINESFFYLRKFKTTNGDLNESDNIRYKLAITMTTLLANDFEKAAELYTELLIEIDEDKYPHFLSYVCTNSILAIVNLKIQNIDSLLELSYQILIKMISENKTFVKNRYLLYSHIGLALAFVKSYLESLIYFYDAFRIYEELKLPKDYRYFSLLFESYDSFKNTNKLNNLVELFLDNYEHTLNFSNYKFETHTNKLLSQFFLDKEFISLKLFNKLNITK